MVLVLEASILPNAKGVGCVAGNGLLAHDMLRALHHSCLAHLLEGILPLGALLCKHEVCLSGITVSPLPYCQS